LLVVFFHQEQVFVLVVVVDHFGLLRKGDLRAEDDFFDEDGHPFCVAEVLNLLEVFIADDRVVFEDAETLHYDLKRNRSVAATLNCMKVRFSKHAIIL